MAKNQGIIRLRGSIDGVTYTEGVNGKLSRSRSSLNKAKMDSNPKFHNLRMAQEELSSYSKYGALLRSGIRSELAMIKPYMGTRRLNKILNALKNEDLIHRLGQRTVASGLTTPKGLGMLHYFDFYGKKNVNQLVTKEFVVDFAVGEALIRNFNPLYDLIAPRHATHVGFKAIYMGLDFDRLMVSSERSDQVYLPLEDVAADLSLKTTDLPSITENTFFLVQVVFYKELNGFRELEAVDEAALTIIALKA
ncbi:hypothetical protein [Flavobacterium sp.]|uniref:hypothetical protein n=1 Tax=Flavobacterium sp. TaxID=239 RepID=UPI002637C05F|nr:hypothetical protein [Flavobacterium sp.]MDD3004003.1 hypothetical protein [Flavobacterium sp.]